MKEKRIEKKFSELRASGEKALVLYLTAGDPDFETSLELLACAASSGVDILEVGVPFSDPMADGPVIQRAFQRSLGNGFRTSHVFRLIREFRKYFSTPVVIFGYLNPILAYGVEKFFDEAGRAGADGVLLVDLPFEEWEPYKKMACSSGLDWIGLVAPTSGDERISKIARGSSGFVYVISVTGITGARNALPGEYIGVVKKVRGEVTTPVVVGFGISSPEMAREVASHCDGVVVGSAAVRIIERWEWKREKMIKELSSFVENVKMGLTDGVF